MKRINFFVVALLSFVIVACSTTSKIPKSEAYESFYNESPLTVLIAAPINNIDSEDSEDQDKYYFPADDPLPVKAFDSAVPFNSAIPIDHSTKVNADEFFYSSLEAPFTKKGYTIISREQTKEIIEAGNSLNSLKLLKSSLSDLGKNYDIDMVVFTLIHEWDHDWRHGMMDVKFEHIIKSTHTDEVLYSRAGTVKYDLVPDATRKRLSVSNFDTESRVYSFNPSVERFFEVAKACNLYALSNIPYAKNHKNFGIDLNENVNSKEFKVYLNEYSEI